MGVDVTHIIRNNFVDDGLRKTRVSYCRETIERLRERLGIKRRIGVHYYKYSDNNMDVECRFELPKPWDVEFFLHEGYWHIESYWHYCQIVIAWDGRLYVRDLIKEIAKALDATEVWHAEEYLTWNGGVGMDDISGENWFDFIKKKFPEGIPEYRADDWKDKKWGKDEYDYKPIYHDDLHDYEISNNVI